MAKDEWTEVNVATGEVWDREAPIEGEFLRRQNNVGPNASMLYTLKTKNGDIGVWGSTVLDTKFADLDLHCFVKIEPLGKTKSPQTGREYQDFKVSYKANPKYQLDGEEIPADDIPPFDE